MAAKREFYIRDIQTNRIVKNTEVDDLRKLLGLTGTGINNGLNRDTLLLNNHRYLIHLDKTVLRDAPIIISSQQCCYEVTLTKVTAMSSEVVYQTKEPVGMSGLDIYPKYPIPSLGLTTGCALARVMINTPITLVMSGYKLVIRCVLPKSIEPVTLDLIRGSLSYYTLAEDDKDTHLTMEEMVAHLATTAGIGPVVYPPMIFEIYRKLLKMSRGKTLTAFGCTFEKHDRK